MPKLITDKKRDVAWRSEMLPFDETVGSIDGVRQSLRFPDQYRDEETDYHYNYHRDYDPTLGRYLQSDPIGLGGGVNTFGYVLGNPLAYIDPLGTDAVKIDFWGYPITVGSRQYNLVHSGVLLINNDTGFTRYYEFGRYKPTDPNIVGVALPSVKGNVRSFPVPNVEIGADGRPTADSLAVTLESISQKAGKGISPSTSYIEGDFDSASDVANIIANDPNREVYKILGNNCRSFAGSVADGG